MGAYILDMEITLGAETFPNRFRPNSLSSWRKIFESNDTRYFISANFFRFNLENLEQIFSGASICEKILCSQNI